MDIGIHFANFTFPGRPQDLRTRVAECARMAEEVGCTWFTCMDHWFQMEQFAPATEPMLEGYTTLGFLAGQTATITLSLLVTGVTYRRPGLLAKTVTTLDVLSGGRAMLGIGAAWYEREHRGLGVDFPPVRERFERLEETLQICAQMWSEDDGPYEGTHYQLAETICEPKPLQQPHPPVLIGGGGERRTLRLVAQYADACNLFGEGPEAVAHKLTVLQRHCESIGRDPATLKKTILGFGDPATDPDGFLSSMEEYGRLGIEHVQVMPLGPDPVAFVAALGDKVIGRLKEI
ncbi:MAG TPA: LLM class F420-dependent oxidoreductase [Acidimicrobiales bacterium]|nr:LLM class F420-dependent oxidoreductase [Acidimicrobiales bacterium]